MFDDHRELGFSIFHIMNESLVDLRMKQRQFMAVGGMMILGPGWPSPSSSLERFTNAVDRNDGPIGGYGREERIRQPEQLEILTSCPHRV
jgi:hypothetical protein